MAPSPMPKRDYYQVLGVARTAVLLRVDVRPTGYAHAGHRVQKRRDRRQVERREDDRRRAGHVERAEVAQPEGQLAAPRIRVGDLLGGVGHPHLRGGEPHYRSQLRHAGIMPKRTVCSRLESLLERLAAAGPLSA